LGDIVPEQRAMGKQLGYSQLYGSGAAGLAHKLNIPKKQAVELLDKYFAAVPKLVAFLETLRQRALSQGYVASYYGRRRPLPEIYSANPKIQWQRLRPHRNVSRAFGINPAGVMRRA
jgi:DNA polymerase-1